MKRLDARNPSGGRKRRRLRGLSPGAVGSFALALALALLLRPVRADAAGAIESAAQEATRGLGHPPRSVVVVAAPLATDVPAPRGDELALRMAALVAAQLGPAARTHPQTAALPAARALAGRASGLVYVVTEIARGDLRATVDLYPNLGNAWDRIRNPLGPPLGHAFASVKVDAEVRAFLLPLLLEQATVHRVRHDEQEVLAAACGDVDGDGGNELVLVSRERVALGRVRGGRFAVERSVPWSDLAPRAPVPLREPLAGAVVVPGGIAVGSTDRGARWLGADLAPGATLYGVPESGGDGLVCLLAEPSAGAFDGAAVDCAAARDAKPRMAVPAPRFDAFAAGSIVDAGGVARAVIAVREPSGKLRVRIGDTAAQAPEGVFGGQISVGDLDEDGVPEIVTGAEAPDDALDVWSVAADGAELRPRLHLPAPGGVRALAVCPPEEGSEPVLVAVVGNELWLVRAGVGEAGATPTPSRGAGP